MRMTFLKFDLAALAGSAEQNLTLAQYGSLFGLTRFGCAWLGSPSIFNICSSRVNVVKMWLQ